MKTQTSKKTVRKRNSQPKQDIYSRVTETILAQLEKGTVPWNSPHFARVGFPANFQSRNDYQGCNVLLLGMCGYVSPHFLTYKQAQAMGGQVRKGEKGHLVIKYGQYQKKEANENSQEEETSSRGYLRGYTVFNACQIDGIDFPQIPLPEFTPSERVAKAQGMIDKMPNPPKVHEGRVVQTCYTPASDEIDIPNREYFSSEERFYKSLFHELVHSTGAAHRLARKTLIENKGMVMGAQKIYSKEELVAEIGAAFLCAQAGIVMDGHKNSTAYLEGWLKVLKTKDNRRWIAEAAAQAQKAVHYILDTAPPEHEQQ